MPEYEDSSQGALDISGDPAPATPLTQKQMAGAQKSQVNRTRAGPRVKPGPAPAQDGGKPPAGSQNDGNQSADGSQIDPASASAPPPPPAQHGIGPAWQALHDGIAQTMKDPEWMKHPLMRLMSENPYSVNPEKYAQDAWAASQWAGRLLNAAVDPNAIHAGAASIEHDNSIQGRIAQNVFAIHDNPVDEAAWNFLPNVFAIGAEWNPLMWVPAMTAMGPQNLSDLPGEVKNMLGADVFHPALEDPNWYARMGSYILAALMLKAHAPGTAAKLVRFDGHFAVLDRFTTHANALLGGGVLRGKGLKGILSPTPKTPMKFPEKVDASGEVVPGTVRGPEGKGKYAPDSEAAKYATWWNSFMAPLEEHINDKYTPTPKKPVNEVSDYGRGERVIKAPQVDPKAKRDLATILKLPPGATAQQIKDRFMVSLENRELSPSASLKIKQGWPKFGQVMDMLTPIKYYSPGEADFRDVQQSVDAIPDVNVQHEMVTAMRMANGVRAGIVRDIHAYGNNLVEAMAKGLFGHTTADDHYIPRALDALERVIGSKGSAELDAIEDPAKYDALDPHQKAAVNYARRLLAEIRNEEKKWGARKGWQPDYAPHERVARPDLDTLGIPKGVQTVARNFSTKRLFGSVRKESRAIQLYLRDGQIMAEEAHQTIHEAQAAVEVKRGQLRQDLIEEALANPALQKIVDDPQKFNALLHAEMPDYETNLVKALRTYMPKTITALRTFKTVERAKRQLVQDPEGIGDARWHPMAVSIDEKGQQSSPTLDAHFKDLHGASSVPDFYRSRGYKRIDHLGANLLYHPSFADPLNRWYKFHEGDSDGIFNAMVSAPSKVARHVIMWDPAWHGTNMVNRLGILYGQHPRALAQVILKARGVTGMSEKEVQEWLDAQRHERLEHGGTISRANEDMAADIQKYITQQTGDIEAGLPIDHQTPIARFSKLPAQAWGAVKGGDAWWQNHVNSHLWESVDLLKDFAYIVYKDDHIQRGMSEGDARLMAASKADTLGGQVSPTKWMYNPTMQKLSQTGLFAVNWWRTLPGVIFQTYDNMGMRSTPALSHAWALNVAKTAVAMALFKVASDNMLNWLLSGHWQFQNAPGYQQSVTMDRYSQGGSVDLQASPNFLAGLPGGPSTQQVETSAADPATGAHVTMENPFARQPNDVEKALGITEAAQQGHWSPGMAAEGASQVATARVAPLVDLLFAALNVDPYGSIKTHSARAVDPSSPSGQPSAASLAAGAMMLTPLAFQSQALLQGIDAKDGTINWGPWKGAKVPGWLMRAFDPNDPASLFMGLLGVRGGYPTPIKTDQRGLSTAELNQLAQYTNDWSGPQGWLAKNQTSVTGGGQSWSDFAYNYKQQSAAHANEVQGLVGGTSDYMQGADGVLSQYEAVYNDPQATDQNGDINWQYVQKQQDALQAKTDPATWRLAMATKDKQEMQFPVLHAYKNSLQNYKNFQDSYARAIGGSGEELRSLIAQAASAANFKEFEAAHPILTRWYAAKRDWELHSSQGFAYGMFTNNTYVMQIVQSEAPGGNVATVEAKDLPAVEKLGVDPTGGFKG